MKSMPEAYGYLWCAVASIFSATATLFLKKSAGYSSYTDITKLAWLGGAVSSYVLGFFCYERALSRFEMSTAYPLMTSFTMMAVAIFGAAFLSENISFSKVLGMLMLCVACWLMTR